MFRLQVEFPDERDIMEQVRGKKVDITYEGSNSSVANYNGIELTGRTKDLAIEIYADYLAQTC